MKTQLALCTKEFERNQWLRRRNGAQWALPALSPQILFVFWGLVLGRWGEKSSFPAWVRTEEQSSFRTKGQKKHHAGLVVSMATRVPGGVNKLVFQILAALLWWGEKGWASLLLKFLWISQLVHHVWGASPFLLHNAAGLTQADVTGPSETWRLWGLWTAFGVTCRAQSSVCCMDKKWVPLLYPKASLLWCHVIPSTHVFLLASGSMAADCPGVVQTRVGQPLFKSLLGHS